MDYFGAFKAQRLNDEFADKEAGQPICGSAARLPTGGKHRLLVASATAVGDGSPVAATAQQNHCVTELAFLQRLDPSDRPGLENDHESNFSLRLPAVGTLLNLAGGCQGMH
jgi:hypothetical protein